jgi:hypothetical protein
MIFAERLITARALARCFFFAVRTQSNDVLVAKGHGNRQSAIGNRQSAIGNRQSAIGNRQIGYRLSVIGYRLSVIGYRLSVIGMIASAGARGVLR